MATFSRPASLTITAKRVKNILAPRSVATRAGSTNGRAPATHRDLFIPDQVELGRLRGLGVLDEGKVHPSDPHRSKATREALADGHHRLPVAKEPNAPAAMGRAAGVRDAVHGEDPGRGLVLLLPGHRHGHAMPAAISHPADPAEGQRLHAVAAVDLHVEEGVPQAHRQQVRPTGGPQEHGVL